MISWQEISLQVLRRDGCQCQSCGKQPAGQTFQIVSRSISTSGDQSDFVTLCGRCHMLAGTVSDWIITKVWKIQTQNIALEKQMVQGRIKRKVEQLKTLR